MARRRKKGQSLASFNSEVKPTPTSIKYRPDYETRIIGGEEVDPPHKYPFIVAILYSTGIHYCGGMLIHPEWVLTAAHCEVGPNDKLVFGAHDLSNQSDTQTRGVLEQPTDHPDHTDVGEQDLWDYSLVHLDSPVQLTDTVNTISPSSSYAYSEDGWPCTVIGWGLMEGGLYSDVLMEAHVPIVDDCGNTDINFSGCYPNCDEIMICAGGEAGVD